MATAAYLILDEAGFVVASHIWGAIGNGCPIQPPPGGIVVETDVEVVNSAVELMKAGKRPFFENDHVSEWQPHQMKLASEIPVHVTARREKMIAIANQSVAGRGRVFKSFPHIHLMDQHRHIDVLAMYVRGKLKETDKILTRNLKTGEYEEVTVGILLDQIEQTFHLRQQLRQHDQEYRDKVNVIFTDPAKTDEQKATEIEALAVPEFLDIEDDSDATNLRVRNKKNGT